MSRPMYRVPTRKLDRRLSPEAANLFAPLLQICRNMGIGITGTRGVGKSTLQFLFAWLDFVILRKPTIVISPVPSIFNSFVSAVCSLCEEDQKRIWPNVHYVNLNGQEINPGDDPLDWYVVPTPILYRSGIGRDSGSVIARRLPETYLKLEDSLRAAPIQGARAVTTAAVSGSIILHICGLGVSSLANLIRFCESDYWQAKMREAVAKDPTTLEAVNYFRHTIIPLSPGRRFEQTNALLSRLELFSDPVMAAQFDAPEWAIPWIRVFTDPEPQFIFYDLSQESSEEYLQFKMTWLFTTLVDAIKRYGARQDGDRTRSISLIVDEIGAMLGEKETPLAKDINRFVNTYSRNYNCEFICSMQEPYQLRDSPMILDTLMSLGTKFYGRMTNPSSGRLIADYAIKYNPMAAKEIREVPHVSRYMNYIEKRVTFYSKSEQNEMGRAVFDALPKMTFISSRTVVEGDTPLPLERFSLAPFKIEKPDPYWTQYVKKQLSMRDGIRVRDALARQPQRAEPSDGLLDISDSDVLEADFMPITRS